MKIYPKSYPRPTDVIMVNRDLLKNTMQIRGQFADELLFADGTRLTVDYTKNLVLVCRFIDHNKPQGKNYIVP